jgi:hypothetical protein
MKIYPLLHVENKKPLDIGCGRLTASIDPNGLFCSMNGYHSKQGYITCSSLPPFSNEKWYNSDDVRSYRKRIAGEIRGDSEPAGFGVIPVPADEAFETRRFVDEDGNAGIYYVGNELQVFSVYRAAVIRNTPVIVQSLFIHNRSTIDQEVRIQIGGTLSLKRCAYGQLTEGGPIPMPASTNRIAAEGNAIHIVNEHLPAKIEICGFEEGRPISLQAFAGVFGEPTNYTHFHTILAGQGNAHPLTFIYQMVEDVNAGTDPETLLEALKVGREAGAPFMKAMAKGLLASDSEQAEAIQFIVKRNIQYITSCCSVPTVEDAYCIITDHQLLPLSWNRDAYYMMKLLMEASKQERMTSVPERERLLTIVKGHLLWMFEQAQRPQRYWGRAYLTNGYCKDAVFQLDQQCYPLLELVEYFEWTGDRDTVVRVLPTVNKIIDMILQHKHEERWVFLTGETPADDEVEYPFHFSSQVLAWRTFQRLQALNDQFRFSNEAFGEWAERIRTTCLQSFKTQHMGKTLFAYLTDLEGNYSIYHDANDLPTVLAPMWGFCEKEDPVWRNTMEFSFTASNQGGYYEGAFAGLGSVHTPCPWPLGDAQEMLFRWLIQDEAGRDEVLSKLLRIVQWDGLFSEAVHQETGRVESRHWFSWPGAFISTVLLETARG